SATYDEANQQLAFGDKTMIYDANGNLETLTDPTGTSSFVWDARNRLRSLSGPAVVGSFDYDAFNRRIQKVIDTSLSTYQYDGANIIREVLDGAEVIYFRGLNIDEAFSRNGQEFHLVDALGSTVGLAGPTGAVGTTYSYEPFGRTLLTGIDSDNPFQFTGREKDILGLYFYRARFYGPGFARFTSEDPIGLLGGDVNLYAYVGANPVNFTDPSGKLVPLLALGLIGTGGLVNGTVQAGAAAFDTQDPVELAKAFGKGFLSGSVGTGTGLLLTLLTANPVIVGAGSGLASNLTNQLLDNGFRFDRLSARKATVGTALGATLGPLGKRIPGLRTRGRLPDPFKPRGITEFGPNSLRLLGQAAVTGSTGGVIGGLIEQ
ncbi:MAG: RHS repeat-associated core domain-containing protein, partial [Dehalococcoidia bacterium]